VNARLSTIVAGCLGGVLVLSVLSIAVLAGLDKATPGVLENLAAGALGALAALLARVGGDTQAVEVVNPPQRPVPVEGDAGRVELSELALLTLFVLLLLVLVGVIPTLR
jgi:hypothetical protein